VSLPPRTARIERKTGETDIAIELNVDGRGESTIQTGIPFFDHMLTLLARHSLVDLQVKAIGDIAVDLHHTVEDTGIALGQAFAKALGDKRGIRRYGWAYLPMDETLARVVVDFSGRPFLVWRGLEEHAYAKLTTEEKTQDVSSSFRFGLAREFFQGFANEARCNLHCELIYGGEPHHAVEAIFKGFAKAVDAACQHDARVTGVPSTKGVL
jgi:imidazoleglycerol-phosphate dehydratase